MINKRSKNKLEKFCYEHSQNNHINQRVKGLMKINYNEQKSDAWLKERYNYITGSDIGTALGINYYKSINEFIYEKVSNKSEFKGNIATAHGSKYEDVAVLIIEYLDKLYVEKLIKDSLYLLTLDNVDIILKYMDLKYYYKIYDFGLICNYKDRFLGASPDGIRLDGRMKEIKCPFTRKIGKFIPKGYHAQMQIQMQCANLNSCDFFQATIQEYESKQEYLEDGNNYVTENGLYKGIILEKNGLYKYPSRLDLSKTQMNSWIKKYSTYKPIYWKLMKYTNVLVERDEKWFNNNINELKDVWQKVVDIKKSGNVDQLFNQKYDKSEIRDLFLDSSDEE